MPNADRTLEGYGRKGPPALRLSGALAAGTVFAAGETRKERVGVAGLTEARVRVKLSATPTGTLTVTAYPILSDGVADDTVGTRGAAFAAGTGITTANEAVIDLDLRGEKYVEIEAVMSATTGDTATLAYVEITGTPE